MKKLTILIIIPFFFLIVTCKKKEVLPKSHPQINTLDAVVQTDGVAMYGEVQGFNGETVTNHGFVWSTTTTSPTLDSAYSISLGAKSDLSKFEAKVNRGFAQSLRTYYRAFVKTDKHVVYGQLKNFLPTSGVLHIVNDFYPKKGTWGDTLTVKGNYFDKIPENNKIFFGPDIETIVIHSDDSTMKFVVPRQLLSLESKILVNVGKVSEPVNGVFKLYAPRLDSIVTENAHIGDTVEIKGDFYYHPNSSLNEVLVDGKVAKLLDASRTSFKTYIRTDIKKAKFDISLKIGSEIEGVKEMKLNAPQIDSIRPNRAKLGDRVIVYGKYFSPYYWSNTAWVDTNQVDVGSPLRVNQLGIQIKSYKAGYNDVVVSFAGQSDTLKNGVFVTDIPTFSDFSPKQAYQGDTIEIDGLNLDLNSIKIYFDDIEAKSFYQNDKRYCVVPYGNKNNQVYLTLKKDDLELKSGDIFTLKPPKIDSIVNNSGGYVIYGKGVKVGKVEIGGQLSSTFSNGSFSYPNWLDFGVYKNVTFVNSAGQIATYNYSKGIAVIRKLAQRYLNLPWRNYNRINVVGHFLYNNMMYLLYDDGRLYKADLFSSSVTQMTRRPEPITLSAYFQINNRFYLVCGRRYGEPSKQVWEYNPENDTWTRKNDFPGEERINAAGFSLNGRGYMSGGYTKKPNVPTEDLYEVWSYNSTTDSWTQKKDVPFSLFRSSSYFAQDALSFNTFIVNGKAYLRRTTGLSFQYNPVSDSWKELSTSDPNYAMAIYNNNFAYIGVNGVWQYNDTNNIWTKVFDNKQAIYGYTFLHNNRIFVFDERFLLYEYNLNPPLRD